MYLNRCFSCMDSGAATSVYRERGRALLLFTRTIICDNTFALLFVSVSCDWSRGRHLLLLRVWPRFDSIHKNHSLFVLIHRHYYV